MATESKAKAKVFIVYHSVWGHIAKMADAVAKGVEEAGAEVTLFRVPEILPKEVLEKMHAAPPNDKHAIITPEKLVEADAIIFGVPTRFGTAGASMRAFIDSLGGLWAKGALNGKLGSVFFSSAQLGGGQETTALTFFTALVHLGMLIVPIGYSNPLLMDNSTVHGGSPYGAGTLSNGDGSRQPSEGELKLAQHQGKHVSTFAIQLKKGRDAK